MHYATDRTLKRNCSSGLKIGKLITKTFLERLRPKLPGSGLPRALGKRCTKGSSALGRYTLFYPDYGRGTTAGLVMQTVRRSAVDPYFQCSSFS